MLSVSLYAGSGDEWDTFVRGQHGWSFCHLYAWRRVMERALEHEGLYLEARFANGELAGVLPLVRVRSRLFGHFLVSMPFLSYGGPIGSPDAVRSLAAEATRLAVEQDATLLELRSRHAQPLDLEVSHRKITVVLDLPADVDALHRGYGGKLRSQIRRPEKEGITVRLGPDQVAPFHQVFTQHMRYLGTPTHRLAFFREIVDAFGDDVWCGCAYLGDVPVAAGLGFRSGGEFEMTWASAIAAHNRLSPNMLLYATFLDRAVGEGLSVFNFGRCTPGGGTHRFKQQWGTRDEQLWWYQHSKSGDASTPSPSEGKYGLAVKAWQRLPLWVTNRVGPHIVRLIP